MFVLHKFSFLTVSVPVYGTLIVLNIQL